MALRSGEGALHSVLRKKVKQKSVVASSMYLPAAQLCRDPAFPSSCSVVTQAGTLGWLHSPPDISSRPAAWFCSEVVISKATGCGPTNTGLQLHHRLGQLHQPGGWEEEEEEGAPVCEGNYWAAKAGEGSVPSRRPAGASPWLSAGGGQCHMCLAMSSCVTPLRFSL